MKGSDIDAKKLDKLANGVDKLGRNVSLTDNEYQEFLELNNSLAKLYPELVVRVDEAGNHFVGLGNEVGNVTGKIEEFIEKQQEIADARMFEETGGFLWFGKTTLAEKNLETEQGKIRSGFLNDKKLFDNLDYT
jgi:hypothetical protein